MEFSGTFELDGADLEEVWLALSDPAMVQHALRGCTFLVRVDDDVPEFDALREEYHGDAPELTSDRGVVEARAFQEGATYAALVEASVGSVSPSFETVVTVDERSKPHMAASGEGTTGDSSFEMDSWMELSETDDGVTVEWGADADVFGRLAQMGQRMLSPVANRMTKQFFRNLQEQLESLELEGDGDVEAATGEADLSEGADGATENADSDANVGPGTESTALDDDARTSTETDDSGEDPDGPGGLVARIKRLVGLG